MARTSTGFGTRQGGLAQSYRSGVSPRPHAQAAPQRQTISAPPPTAQRWEQPPQATGIGGTQNLYALNNPVFMRWVSGGIDLIILFIMTMFTMLGFDILDGGLSGGSEIEILENGPLTMTLAALWFGYGLLFESSGLQGTPGKIMTGLVVTDMEGRKIGFGHSFGRACGKVFSTFVPLYIPYIMVAMTERKQSLHDKMCGTLVFRRRDLANSTVVFD